MILIIRARAGVVPSPGFPGAVSSRPPAGAPLINGSARALLRRLTGGCGDKLFRTAAGETHQLPRAATRSSFIVFTKLLQTAGGGFTPKNRPRRGRFFQWSPIPDGGARKRNAHRAPSLFVRGGHSTGVGRRKISGTPAKNTAGRVPYYTHTHTNAHMIIYREKCTVKSL